VEENPSTSIRQLAREFQVSQFVVCRTLKEQGLYPHHVQRVEALHLSGYIRRQEFVNRLFKSASINLIFS
jgi:hypothetical protein